MNAPRMYSRDMTFFHSASLVVGGLCLRVSMCDCGCRLLRTENHFVAADCYVQKITLWLQIVTYRKSLCGCRLLHTENHFVAADCYVQKITLWLQIVTYRKSLETVLNTTVTVFSRI